MLRQSVKLEINVDTCGKMRELLVLRCAQHKQKRTERDPFPFFFLSVFHFLFTYLRAMKLSSPLKVCNASGGTAVAGARKLQTTKCCPPLSPSLSLSLSLCLPLAAGLQLIMSKLAITATLARRSLGRRCYAWLPKYFRAAKLIYKFPLELCPARSVARSRCHMLWMRGVSTWRI